jgi:hypothetical protein
MTEQELKDLGLSGEQLKAALESLSEDRAPKSVLDLILARHKKDIDDLKTANELDLNKLATEFTSFKRAAAVTAALYKAKARNPETVKPLLKSFLEKAELDGEGVKGLSEEIKKLAEGKDTKFLFGGEAKIIGAVPGESRDGLPGASWSATLEDAVKSAIDR